MSDSSIIGVDRVAWDAVWHLYDNSIDLPKAIKSIQNLLKDHMDPAYHEALLYACNKGYDIPHLWDSLSNNQFKSKIWLVNELSKILKDKPMNVQLFGGWLGFPLIDILANKINLVSVENIDLDSNAIDLFKKIRSKKDLKFTTMGTCASVSEHSRVNREWSIDLIINTSSEHMDHLPKLIGHKTYRSNHCLPLRRKLDVEPHHSIPMIGPCLFAIQSNNMFHIDDHINCVNHEDELVENCRINKILYKGSLDMPNGYKRFMVIGYA